MSDYDKSIHSNPDALAWAKFFCDTLKEKPGIASDEGTMLSWFANAMMAKSDHEAEVRRKALMADAGLDELEAKAKAATPGPWVECRANNHKGGCKCGLLWSKAADVTIAVTHKPQDDEPIVSEVNDNTRYMAAVSPDVILSLIARVREAERKTTWADVRSVFSVRSEPWARDILDILDREMP